MFVELHIKQIHNVIFVDGVVWEEEARLNMNM